MADALTIKIDGVDLTHSIDFSTVQMQLAGSQETASCTFDVEDPTNALSIIAEMLVTVTEVGTSDVLFGGFIRSTKPGVNAKGRTVHVTAYDYNSLLDRQLVISDSRAAGESDNDRLTYMMTTYGDQFSSDYSQIATLAASMPAQKFVAITLRQAIERVLGQASTLSAYHVDPTGRLVTYDRSTTSAAPFDVVVGTPGAGEIAVDNFSFDFDSSNLANAVYVVGATLAGSGWKTDPTSIAAYGRRERFFNAPDSDTAAKRDQVGAAVLQDGKDPVPRGSFTTQSPNDGWRIGQHIVITAAAHGLSAATLRIARVTARYLNGLGDRSYTIEVGAPLPTLSVLLAKRAGGGAGVGVTPGGGGWPGGTGWTWMGTECCAPATETCWVNQLASGSILDNFHRSPAAGTTGATSFGNYSWVDNDPGTPDMNVTGNRWTVDINHVGDQDASEKTYVELPLDPVSLNLNISAGIELPEPEVGGEAGGTFRIRIVRNQTGEEYRVTLSMLAREGVFDWSCQLIIRTPDGTTTMFPSANDSENGSLFSAAGLAITITDTAIGASAGGITGSVSYAADSGQDSELATCTLEMRAELFNGGPDDSTNGNYHVWADTLIVSSDLGNCVTVAHG